MARRHLDTLLLEGNVIDGRQLDACREYARSHGVGFAEAALATKVVHDAAQLADFIATRIQGGQLKISELDIPDSTLAAVPPEIAAQHKVMPVYRDKRNLVVAIADVRTLPVLEAVKFKLGCNLKPIVAPAEDIEKAVKANYIPDTGSGRSSSTSVGEL